MSDRHVAFLAMGDTFLRKLGRRDKGSARGQTFSFQGVLVRCDASGADPFAHT